MKTIFLVLFCLCSCSYAWAQNELWWTMELKDGTKDMGKAPEYIKLKLATPSSIVEIPLSKLSVLNWQNGQDATVVTTDDFRWTGKLLNTWLELQDPSRTFTVSSLSRVSVVGGEKNASPERGLETQVLGLPEQNDKSDAPPPPDYSSAIDAGQRLALSLNRKTTPSASITLLTKNDSVLNAEQLEARYRGPASRTLPFLYIEIQTAKLFHKQWEQRFLAFEDLSLLNIQLKEDSISPESLFARRRDGSTVELSKDAGLVLLYKERKADGELIEALRVRQIRFAANFQSEQGGDPENCALEYFLLSKKENALDKEKIEIQDLRSIHIERFFPKR